MAQMNRRLFGAAMIAAAASLGSAPAQAQAARDANAERFVQDGAQRVISVLADRSLSEQAKEQSFRRVIDDVADVPKITTFVLGKYARTITPRQRTQFAAAFRAYAERVYRNRLDDYRGEVVKVTGSTVRKPGDVIVTTQISGGQVSQPEVVRWRVMGGGSSWKAVDVQFRGVWLAITQQQDFVSTVDNARGDIDVLIARLNRDAKLPPPRI